jgi:hypothetical protein
VCVRYIGQQLIHCQGQNGSNRTLSRSLATPFRYPNTRRSRTARDMLIRTSLHGSVFCRPGSDLLFQALRLSTIGAGEFNGRVRDGIGFLLPATTTRPAKNGLRRGHLDARCQRQDTPAAHHVRLSKQAGFSHVACATRAVARLRNPHPRNAADLAVEGARMGID